MGFKDLALFDDSLLAKQSWWLLQIQIICFMKSLRRGSFPIAQ